MPTKTRKARKTTPRRKGAGISKSNARPTKAEADPSVADLIADLIEADLSVKDLLDTDISVADFSEAARKVASKLINQLKKMSAQEIVAYLWLEYSLSYLSLTTWAQ